jgi:predicted nucleic acid-binding protein
LRALRVKPVLVDSNVLIDVATRDARWYDWSASELHRLANETALVINRLIYAEVSISFARIEEVENALPTSLFRHENIPYEAAFLAGKAFLTYRRRGGARSAPLPDFMIGAHAAVSGLRLLTRDPARYRSYYPTVEVIGP